MEDIDTTTYYRGTHSHICLYLFNEYNFEEKYFDYL